MQERNSWSREVSWSCCATKPKGHDKVETTVQGECFLNERQPNSLEHEDRSGWQRGKTRLQWQMWLSTQRIGKDIRASSYFFTRRAADVVSEACFTVMTGDRHDERAAMDFSMIIFAQIPSWLEWIFNSYASLVIFFIISVFFCFVFEHWTLYTIWVLAVLDFNFRTEACNLTERQLIFKTRDE